LSTEHRELALPNGGKKDFCHAVERESEPDRLLSSNQTFLIASCRSDVNAPLDSNLLCDLFIDCINLHFSGTITSRNYSDKHPKRVGSGGDPIKKEMEFSTSSQSLMHCDGLLFRN